MKTIKEIRSIMDSLQISEQSSHLRYLPKMNLDFDVYLPSKGINLQRDLVWTIDQKRELINSIIVGRKIPHCAIINTLEFDIERYQVIDGKQRLSTMLQFINNEFDLIVDGESYYYNDLPADWKLTIHSHHIRYYIVNEEYGNKISDQQKINWFMFINFAGTPQDIDHFVKLCAE